MTDRELLDLAAKAAEIEIYWTDNYGGQYLTNRSSPRFWRPLTDDGDALRLAVKLGLGMMVIDVPPGEPFSNAGRLVGEPPNERLAEAYEDHKGDPYAATRRAIVRAAAAIGSAS
jgi:hypothetical protein